jgi:soluble lytic murein transglycosylase-like protein
MKKILCVLWFAFLISPLLTGDEGKEKPYRAIIDRIALKYDIPSTLIHAIIRAESNYDCLAVSGKGAAGLMQLMPETAQTYGIKDVFDPDENIEGGAKFLKDLIRLYDGKRDLVLAAYNAGQEAVKKFRGIPPYPETINYIKKIQDSYASFLIRNKATIYKFYDRSGRLWLTTDRRLYLANKAD